MEENERNQRDLAQWAKYSIRPSCAIFSAMEEDFDASQGAALGPEMWKESMYTVPNHIVYIYYYIYYMTSDPS